MTEADVQRWIRDRLDKRKLREIPIINSTSATDLFELIGEREFVTFEDNNDWCKGFELRGDFFELIRPDIVVRSSSSGENRIIIETKVDTPLGYGSAADSQIVRYFLQLLATSKCRPTRDIRRAVLLAAPSSWFKSTYQDRWRYFRNTYAELAMCKGVDITLGEIHCDSIN
jgi:hypothetical protein